VWGKTNEQPNNNNGMNNKQPTKDKTKKTINNTNQIVYPVQLNQPTIGEIAALRSTTKLVSS
jgi:hypothetical protein